MSKSEIVGKYATAKIFAETVEDSCLAQIEQMTNHSAFDLRGTNKHIAIMPDTHSGKGSVIGFTMPLSDKILPETVGVDIGCGMLGVKIQRETEWDLSEIDKQIRTLVPMGFHVHAKPTHALTDRDIDFFYRLNRRVQTFWCKLLYQEHLKEPPPAEVLSWEPPIYSFDWESNDGKIN